MKICICDDNTFDTKVLVDTIRNYYKLNNKIVCTIDTYSFAETFIEEFYNSPNKYDLLFIDIFLNNKNGFSIAEKIKKDFAINIVLYSSSKDFAIEGYSIDIFGYLLKPLNSNKLFSLLDKFHKENNNKIIQLKTNGKMDLIKIKEIIYVESKARKVLFHLDNNEIKSYYYSLDKIQELVDSPVFLRTHKSYLVNMKKITKIQDTHFIVTNGDFVQIKQKAVKKIYQEYNNFILKEH